MRDCVQKVRKSSGFFKLDNNKLFSSDVHSFIPLLTVMRFQDSGFAFSTQPIKSESTQEIKSLPMITRANI